MNVPQSSVVQVVVEGYARALPGGVWEATSTCALITTPAGVRILTDPGCHRRLLLGGLRRFGIAPEAIAYVFLTHSHLDHTMNVALVPHASVVDGYAVYDQDRMTPHSPPQSPTPPPPLPAPPPPEPPMPLAGVIPGTDVEILPTPGHAVDHASLVVPTREGTVMVAGDLFWWLDGQPQVLDVDLPDPFATNFGQLQRSRRLALTRADWIVPGHGAMQRVGGAARHAPDVHASGLGEPFA